MALALSLLEFAIRLDTNTQSVHVVIHDKEIRVAAFGADPSILRFFVAVENGHFPTWTYAA